MNEFFISVPELKQKNTKRNSSQLKVYIIHNNISNTN
jgi:hypothetical protein